MSEVPPRVLTIAGSDSGGGAGIQADLKTFCAHGVYGMSVITAVTAQNTRGVAAVHPVPPGVVKSQLDAVLLDIGADAVKIGMLANAEIAEVVAEGIASHLAGSGVPVVLDPVMVAKGGASLLEPEAVEVVRARLTPLATIVTPNLPEAERLTGRSASNFEERCELARALSAAGPAVLLKGGHAEEDPILDFLIAGQTEATFSHPRLATQSDHGTGCTLSSALAARLAFGQSLRAAVEGSIDYLQAALQAAFPLGSADGHGPVNHLHGGVGQLEAGGDVE